MRFTALKWIIKKTKRSFRGILLLTVLSIALAFVSLAFSLVSKDAVDTAIYGVGTMTNVFVKLAVLLVLQLVLQSVIGIMNVSVQAAAEMNIRRLMFASLMKKDYLEATRYHSAELLNRLNSDVSVICSFTVNIIPALSMFLTKIGAGLVLLFMLDKPFAFAVMVFAPLMLGAAALYRKKFKQLHLKCQETDGKTRAFMQEALQNVLMIKSFLAEKRMIEESDILQKENCKYKIQRAVISALANVGMFLVFNAGYYFALAWGAYRMQNGLITAGTVFAIVTLVSQIQSPLRELSSVMPQFYAMCASAERLIELENMKTDSPKTFFIPYDDIQSIVYENVTFSYSEDAGVDNLSMEIKKGGITAIAGESGVGKSTAMKLLLGIMSPESGSIYFKTNGGTIPINADTRSIFAYVPQGNMVISGTIRENIAFTRKNASDEEIIAAAKTACIWDFIESLDKGLDTPLGEHGLGLSEGQLQRLAIARAVLYGAPVLLFDEATSALDNDTERRMIENIKSLGSRMCVIISHKKTVLDVCDDVIYIEK